MNKAPKAPIGPIRNPRLLKKPGGNSQPKADVPPNLFGGHYDRPPWYKRTYLVYPKFQMTLILLNSAVTVFLFGLAVFMIIRSHLYLEVLVKQTRLPAQSLFQQLLTEQLRSLVIYLCVALVIGVITTAGLTLFLSHRMAGPMIRLKNYFNEIIYCFKHFEC